MSRLRAGRLPQALTGTGWLPEAGPCGSRALPGTEGLEAGNAVSLGTEARRTAADWRRSAVPAGVSVVPAVAAVHLGAAEEVLIVAAELVPTERETAQ